MNVIEEPNLFGRVLFDFMKILYLETPTTSGMHTLIESVTDPRGTLTPDENTRRLYKDQLVLRIVTGSYSSIS